MLDKFFRYLSFFLMAAVVVLLAISVIKKNSYDKHVVELQNQLASSSKTIEEQKGLYSKLAIQESDVQSALDKKDVQLQELVDQLKKSKEELQSATELELRWKHAYEATVAGTQTTIPPTVAGQPDRTKVEFNKDFGAFVVGGYTLTNPAEATLRVSQGKPLEVTVAISQDKSKAWHSYATSSDDNIGVDIKLSAVNPWINEPKWYEKIGVAGTLAVGSTSEGSAVLTGLGLTYKFDKVEVGPSFFIDLNTHVDKYYGVGLVWHPFEQN